MPTPPSLPSSRPGYTNGSSSSPSPDTRTSTPIPASSRSGLGFIALFLGAFLAVIVVAVLGVAIYFGATMLHSAPSASGKDKSPLQNVSSWQLGSKSAKSIDAADKPDIGWWTTTFNLPKNDEVIAYLKNQGIDVGRIVPAHYQETPDGVTLTYQVYAQVPNQLLRLQKVPWVPKNPDLSPFTQVLVLNEGVPAGMFWDTENVMVAADAGTKLEFSWQVNVDKKYNTVSTDRLPFSDNVFTKQQVDQYQTESAHAISGLESQVQEINAQVQSDLQSHLAQIPSNPPKPQMLSRKFGGDGSGEPTKSAERIGGGTVAGAAGGAAFGAVADDPGMGAGIGAGVGLLGGVIYDAVSKSNDKKKFQAKVDAENADRMNNWRAQIKSFNQQRDQAQKDAVAEKARAMSDLANRLTAANGQINHLGAASNGTSNQTSQPDSNQPSGPIQQP